MTTEEVKEVEVKETTEAATEAVEDVVAAAVAAAQADGAEELPPVEAVTENIEQPCPMHGAKKEDTSISGEISPSDESTTSSMDEVLAAANEMHNLSTLCDGDGANSRTPTSENPEQEAALTGNIDDMRTAFYNTALNLFEAAKSLKPYDILYTDGILAQAQYFLNLADNYDTLHSLAKVTLDMPLNKLSSEVPDEVIDRIDDYSSAIKNRMSNMKNKADISDEVTNSVDEIANAIQAKLSGKTEEA